MMIVAPFNVTSPPRRIIRHHSEHRAPNLMMVIKFFKSISLKLCLGRVVGFWLKRSLWWMSSILQCWVLIGYSFYSFRFGNRIPGPGIRRSTDKETVYMETGRVRGWGEHGTVTITDIRWQLCWQSHIAEHMSVSQTVSAKETLNCFILFQLSHSLIGYSKGRRLKKC